MCCFEGVSRTVGRNSALRRAADETQSPVQRGQALWDAIEFLAAGIRVPTAFGKTDRRAIRAALRTVSLTDQQRKRLGDTLQRLNVPSLAVKMRARAAADGAPLRGFTVISMPFSGVYDVTAGGL